MVTDKAVAKHTNSIFAKLDLPPAPDDHRRVLAVLAWLGSRSSEGLYQQGDALAVDAGQHQRGLVVAAQAPAGCAAARVRCRRRAS